ncbi:Twin-arginine translocation pathway signal [Rhodopseudomonas palustris HaA2]|uniref:FAD:protein FMN transferase n=1 Tax=Rhodopseudomonas palustris (strain HaA2) TaxID=316058 RepID=Q2IVB7_RHOP2|nr:FAD:protein FMN transferase [Rhodopseudomonas palustris]ABD07843.1 Twin-arginine translocation pathway signal [Rhodopseudomonas palustris HaA2]
MMPRSLTRRRLITIAAAAAAGSLWPGRSRAAAGPEPVRWQGAALGAQVSIEIHHPDRAAAARLVERSIAEVRRLERQFSLYQPDSAICELNRSGVLIAPDPDMVTLLQASLGYADLTGGAFDPTVQPLWRLYQQHFSSDRTDPAGPSSAWLEQALEKVGYDGLRVTPDRIVLLKRGAAITLNGIAQGYATDRVVELLRNAGLSTTLVDIGEVRALGGRPDGTPWRVGLADPDQPGRSGEIVEIADRAVATSAGAGFRFDPAGRFTHLLDPRTGRSPRSYNSVSVIAPTATAADALSTGFSLMPLPMIQRIVDQSHGVEARILDLAGQRLHLQAASGRRGHRSAS